MTLDIAVTRFNETTWREYTIYKNEHNKIYYNTPCKITEDIPIDNYIVVLEMHNDDNKIKGIGIIKNTLFNKKKIIFSDQNYNRYSYKLLSRIDRESLHDYDESIIKFFDLICFKGYKHLKRGKGIQRIPKYIIDNCKSVLHFPNYFNDLFKNKNKLVI